MAGAGIKRDERIYGASLIDVAPTIVLTLFDLPMGEDMDGRPLLEAFEVPPKVKTIPSWETVQGEAGLHSPGQQLSLEQAHGLMQQFAALGYIEDPTAGSRRKAAESADIENKYNLARTFLCDEPAPTRRYRYWKRSCGAALGGSFPCPTCCLLLPEWPSGADRAFCSLPFQTAPSQILRA